MILQLHAFYDNSSHFLNTSTIAMQYIDDEDKIRR